MDKLWSIIENFNKIKREQAISIVSISVAAGLLYSYLKTEPKHGLKEVPIPESCYPYVGHLFSLGKSPNVKVTEWHKQLGPIIQLKMGVKTWIMIDDPVLAHKIFVTNGVDTSYRRHTVYSYDYYSFKGYGLVFAQPDAAWKKSRAAALTLLAPKQIATYMDSIRYESTALIDRLIESTEKYGSINPRKDLALSSFNVIYKVGFGKRFNSIDDSGYIQFSELIEKTMGFTHPKYDMGSYLPVVKFMDYYVGAEALMKEFIENVRNPFYRNLISNAESEEGPNVVKSLGEETFDMSDDQKLVLMSDLLAAGTDTISLTLSWNFAIMCNYPNAQRRVIEEIATFIETHGRIPFFEDREELPFCVSTIKECMRFKPTTPFGLPHTTIKDLVIDDYFIPKGATIYSSMQSMHGKVGGYYDDADKFIPERFMNNLKTMLSAANGRFEERDHFNFGWGRRICPGIHLAEVEIFSAFVELFSRCTIEPVSESKLPDINGAINGGITLLPYPYQIKVLKRPAAF